MNIQNYGKVNSGRHRKLKSRLIALAVIALIILAAAFVIGKLTENSAEYQLHASLVEENRVLREQAADLEQQIQTLKGQTAELEGKVAEKDEIIENMPTEAPSEMPSEQPSEQPTPIAATTPRG